MPLRVEAVGRFVENDDPRIAEQGGGQAEALAHTHRISADAPVDRVGESDEVEDPRQRASSTPTCGASIRR